MFRTYSEPPALHRQDDCLSQRNQDKPKNDARRRSGRHVLLWHTKG